MRPDDQLPSTPRYREVGHQAELIAREGGQTYVGVEHLLLAIIREGGSVAAVALQNVGCAESVRRELLALMANGLEAEADDDAAQPK